MSNHALRETAQQASLPQRKPGLLSGLVEGLRCSRRLSELQSLLNRSTEGEDPVDAVSAAARIYSGLGEKDRRKALAIAQEALGRCSSLTFDSPLQVRNMIVACGFIGEAAKLLPTDGEGARIVAPYADLSDMLKKAAEDETLFNPANPMHRTAKLAIAEALWELESGGKEFWKARLFDPVTSDFTLMKLLSDPGNGWGFLKENLEQVAIMAAFSRSERKTDFIAALLNDADPQVIKIGLASAIYLEEVPQEFFARALEIGKLGGELNMWVGIFEDACHFKGLLVYADDRQFEGAMGLVYMYKSGVNFLPPLLSLVGREMSEMLQDPPGESEEAQEASRKKAGDVIAEISRCGIPIPGVKVEFH